MGYKCSWVAVRDMSLGEVLVNLELGVTGERSDSPLLGLSAIETIDDWIVILGFGRDAMFDVEEANARNLSFDRWALFFRCSDTGMDSELVEYRDGVKTWVVHHPSIEAGLTTEGDLPQAITELIKAAREAAEDDSEANLYGVPARIGKVLAGFRHDEPVRGADDEPVQELEAR